MRFVCGQCGRQFDVEDAPPGGEVTCPDCARGILVPPPDEQLREQGLTVVSRRVTDGFAAEARRALGQKMYVACGSCGTSLAVPTRLMGKTRRCPSCGKAILIPLSDDQQVTEEPPDEAVEPIDTAVHDREDEERIVESEQADASDLPTAESAPADLPDELAAVARSLDELSVAGPGADSDEQPRRVQWGAVVGWAAVGAAVLIAAGMLYFRLSSPLQVQPEKPEDVVQGADPNGLGKTTPATDPGTGLATRKVVSPTPGKVPARYGEVAAADAVFAAGGYHVAPVGRVYWRVDAEIIAGSAPLSFETAGPDVTLLIGGKRIESLGAPGRGVLPPPSTSGRVRIEAGRTDWMVFLFDVPAAARSGMLRIAGLEPVRISPVVQAAAPGKGGLAGTYLEQSPRNLRPLLRDPVMAAIQSAPARKMVIRPGTKTLRVTMPEAMVIGLATPAGGGVYDIALKYGEHSIQSRLRLFDSGRRIVLYLSDQPFHQLTFKRQ